MWTTCVAVVLIVLAIVVLFVWGMRKAQPSYQMVGTLGMLALLGGLAVANLTAITRFQMKAPGFDANAEIARSVQTVTTKAREVSEIERKVQSLAKEVGETNKQVQSSRKQIEVLLREARETRAQVAEAGVQAAGALDKTRAVERKTAVLLKQASETKAQVASAGRRAIDALKEVEAVEKSVSGMQDNMQQTWRSLLESYALSMGTRNLFPPPPHINAEINRHLNILATFAYPDAEEKNREVARIMGAIKAAQSGATGSQD